ncbi:MAG TPA: hypothetical protein VGC26_05360 [Afipia sp.]
MTTMEIAERAGGAMVLSARHYSLWHLDLFHFMVEVPPVLDYPNQLARYVVSAKPKVLQPRRIQLYAILYDVTSPR